MKRSAIVFILLIFFLVTTSFVRETGVDVQRPSATTAVSKDRATLLIAVTADDQIYVERSLIDIRALRIHVLSLLRIVLAVPVQRFK